MLNAIPGTASSNATASSSSAPIAAIDTVGGEHDPENPAPDLEPGQFSEKIMLHISILRTSPVKDATAVWY
jgi:hypothetical protein